MLREENRDGKKLTEEDKKMRVARKGNSRAGTAVHNCTVFRLLTSSSVSIEERRGQRKQPSAELETDAGPTKLGVPVEVQPVQIHTAKSQM